MQILLQPWKKNTDFFAAVEKKMQIFCSRGKKNEDFFAGVEKESAKNICVEGLGSRLGGSWNGSRKWLVELAMPPVYVLLLPIEIILWISLYYLELYRVSLMCIEVSSIQGFRIVGCTRP